MTPARASGASVGPLIATSERASSIPSSTSPVSSTPEAAAFACTCSGREAPTIAEAASPRRSTHVSAISAMLRPACSAIGRSLSTAIYFLLEQDHFSAFHRIRSDELWHHYDGSAADVHIIGPGGDYRRLMLGCGAGRQPQAVVPAGNWFAAEVAGDGAFALLGCTVAPGFDFADFELADGIALAAACPQHAALVRRLTRAGETGNT